MYEPDPNTRSPRRAEHCAASWDVYDLDFSQDKVDWNEKMSEAERNSFLAIASGFHHGERQVEIELPVFILRQGQGRLHVVVGARLP